VYYGGERVLKSLCSVLLLRLKHTLYVLRSNFLGTALTVFDSGISRHRGKAMPDGSNVREELAAVHYVSH